MVRGSCLCETIAWEVAGDFGFMGHCHCSMCRKTSGAGFVTWTGARAAGFRWLRGEGDVARYESSPGFFRPFCHGCASVVPAFDPTGEEVFMPAGTLADDPGVRPVAHIFTASKAPWQTITDALPRFDAYPPDFTSTVVSPPRRPWGEEKASPGEVRGSCLCGAIAYALTGAPQGFWNCHCSRCRKARGAAHASNLFASASGFRWLQGEERLVQYKLPGARRFGSRFCPTCGSLLPAVFAEVDRVVIPAGGLDDDPGIRPQRHIFVASKAPWFEIRDSLPQHAEYPPDRP